MDPNPSPSTDLLTRRPRRQLQLVPNHWLMAYINYAPMRIGAEDPWALTELAKAGGPGGGLGGTPQLGNLPLRALVCDGAITGWLGYGYFTHA